MMRLRSQNPVVAHATRATLAAVCMLWCAEAVSAQVDSALPLDDTARLEIATSAQEKFDDGMSIVATDPAQAQRLFQESAAGYQRLADLGIQNGELFFNLGNARVQSGDVGLAIGAFLDAQRLLPADRRVADNLSHARSLVSPEGVSPAVTRPIDRIASYWTGSQWASHSIRLVTAISLWTLLWATAAAGIWTGWRRGINWRAVIATEAALVAAVSVTLAVDFARAQMNPLGVVIRDGVVARRGNGDGFAAAFTSPLRQGVEFAMVEVRPGWYRIELADGQTGWVKATDAHIAATEIQLGG